MVNVDIPLGSMLDEVCGVMTFLGTSVKNFKNSFRV